jgi:hypothetical protein
MRTERQNETKKLFPIKLDDFLFSDDMKAVVDSPPPTSKPEEWWEYVPEYHIPDFSQWKDQEAYKREFQKLLRDLKAQPTGT